MMYKLLFALFLFSCTAHREVPPVIAPVISVESTDSSLHFVNGTWYRANQLFTGFIRERYSNDTIFHITPFVNGKEEGWMYTYFPEGNISEKRYYHYGEKDSVHRGWWQNGNPRFEYHFVNGIYHGDYREWYESGEKYKHIHYTNGAEDWATGWRVNGKVYMNFLVRKGRRSGIENSNLCYTVKKERGEY